MINFCRKLFLLLLLAPLAGFSQVNKPIPIGFAKASHSRFASGWIPLDTGWTYQPKGDTSRRQADLYRGQARVPAFAPGVITWFRLRFASDTSLQQPLVMRIYQSGPSEVWLDGRLLYTLGKLSEDPDSIKLFSPNFKNLSFPSLQPGEHLLSVRFADMPSRYPLFFNKTALFFESWIATTDNAQADYFTAYYKNYTNHIYMGIGASVILAVLFFSLFIFFRSAIVNVYFAGTALLLALFLICIQATINSTGTLIWLPFLTDTFSTLFMLGLLLCVFTIFGHKKNRFFKLLMAAGIASVPLSLLVPLGPAGEILAVTIVITMLTVCIRSLRKNKAGAVIIFTGLVVMVGYLLLKMLSARNILPVAGLTAWEPFVLLVPSICLAVYLGYSFGALSSEKQQLLAEQNSLLEKQVNERTAALNQSLDNLRSTQAQLIQSEKMASLGQLTAGIAHEIQNPLNFVNNFSELNTEMIEELKTELKAGNSTEAMAIARDIEGNEEKINHHGKRAAAIVKGMLEHSRQGTATKEPTDINALCEEYLRIAYHAARSKNDLFSATIITDYHGTLEKMNIVAQDFGRVMLNVFNNAFYAIKDKAIPRLTIRTAKINNKILISVKDNGKGIPPGIADKIFQPFFTTKPTGEGTGLGLSLSYDIVKAHGGEISVQSVGIANSTDGQETEFIISLPLSK